MSLKKRTVFGVIWNLFEQLSLRGISTVITVVLARFLAPEAFGVIAMLSVFIQLANSLMESGFKQAIIQRKNTTHLDYCTVFFSNILLGVVSYIVLYIIAPYIADFYNKQELIDLIRIIAITIVINSFRSIQEARLHKELNFKNLVIASIPSALISGFIAIIFAAAGKGVWALAIQMILSSLFTTLALWKMHSWRPTFVFSVDSFIDMYKFGSKLFISGIINTIFRNLYVIVIAKVFSATEAGYYYFAFKIQQLVIFQLVLAVQQVTFSAFTSIQHDSDKLKKGYRQLLTIFAYTVFPVTLLLCAVSRPIFIIFLNESWVPAVPILQLLLLAALLLPLQTVNLNILQVAGRSDLFLVLEIVKKTVLAGILAMTFSQGIYAILIGGVINSIIGYLINSHYSKELTGYGRGEQIRDSIPALLSSLLVMLPLYVVVEFLDLNPYIKLFGFGLLGICLYIGTIFLFFRKPTELFLTLVKKVLA